MNSRGRLDYFEELPGIRDCAIDNRLSISTLATNQPQTFMFKGVAIKQKVTSGILQA